MGRGAGGGPGPGGPMGHGFGIEQTLEELKGKLALNTMQQAQWDAAAAKGKAARESGRLLMEKVRDASRTELAKAEPNLATVASVADDAEQKGRDLRHQVRDQWLKLYAMLTPEQKLIVRDALQQRMNRMESFRERMGQRRGG
jgi:Spy/CpxP family protein refolding chaperone